MGSILSLYIELTIACPHWLTYLALTTIIPSRDPVHQASIITWAIPEDKSCLCCVHASNNHPSININGIYRVLDDVRPYMKDFMITIVHCGVRGVPMKLCD